MQHDTSKTFREIHGSKEALRESLEKMERSALTRAKSFHASLSLRFLTPLKPQPRGIKNVVHLRLTPLHELTTASPYVAVSYAWKQPKGLEAVFGDSMPEYKIWTTDAEPHSPRCPPVVLHQAYTFACEILGTPLLWIDQECIIQTDRKDIENHLQVMHAIYQKSAYTAAILSSIITSQEMLNALQRFSSSSGLSGNQLLAKILYEAHQEQQHFEVALEYLAKDTYFGRTWTFQEKYCARVCHYVIPISHELLSHHEVVKNASNSSSCYVSSKKLMQFEQDLEWELRVATNNSIIEILRSRLVQNIKRLIQDFFRASVSCTDNPSVFTLPKIANTLSLMEPCRNEVVSDRVAVLSNVCRFSWTLKSTLLQSEEYSLSTAVLLLAWLNRTTNKWVSVLPDRILEAVMEHSIKSLVDLWSMALED